jgi:hypothetical protein
MLLTVADLAGPWVLELRVPDRRMGHVAAAQRELGDDLEVSYICETAPTVVHRGQIVRVSLAADADPHDLATVQATTAVDRASLPDARPGAVVQARIHCGRRPVGYVWFHELWEAAQRWWW